jgi:hypothetical protein
LCRNKRCPDSGASFLEIHVETQKDGKRPEKEGEVEPVRHFGFIYEADLRRESCFEIIGCFEERVHSLSSQSERKHESSSKQVKRKILDSRQQSCISPASSPETSPNAPEYEPKAQYKAW